MLGHGGFLDRFDSMFAGKFLHIYIYCVLVIMDKKNIKVILATDCGSTTTKAILIEYVDNEYRLTYRGEAPTTVEAPFEDVTRGVLNSIMSWKNYLADIF